MKITRVLMDTFVIYFEIEETGYCLQIGLDDRRNCLPVTQYLVK